VEEEDGMLRAFEFKWNTMSKAKVCRAFTNHYPMAEVSVITPENYTSFIHLH
jgi:hypothetical protein